MTDLLELYLDAYPDIEPPSRCPEGFPSRPQVTCCKRVNLIAFVAASLVATL
jgi:hypothetical protein